MKDDATRGDGGADGHALPDHPKGTIAICLIYGLLFAIGWVVFYFAIFLPRGPVR